MAIYTTVAEFPDRVSSALDEELRGGEDLTTAVPQSGESFLAKYTKYYLLTDSRFVEFQKAPFGRSKSDSIHIEDISRVEITTAGINVKIGLSGSGFSEEYKIQDPDRTGDAEEFAKTVRKEIAER